MTTETEHADSKMGVPPEEKLQERNTGPTPHNGTRWPPAVALLNLTGLGLGYIALRRWLRWLIHLLATASLIATAFLTNGARSPGLWTAILGAWVVWMTFDGWRLARSTSAPEGGNRWLPVGIAIFLLVLEGAGFLGYRALGRRTFAEGMAAYRDADCRTAMERFHRVTTLYELTFSPDVAAADEGIVECSLLVYAENVLGEGEYAEAVDGYATYLHLYPKSGLIPVARNALAGTYADWAAQVQQTGEYAEAIEKYRIVLNDYPETSAGKQAAARVSEATIAWAAHFREEGQYEQAIQKYVGLLNEYPDTQASGKAAAAAAETYGEWATDLCEDGEYGEAADKYAIVLSKYGDTPAAAKAKIAAADTYTEWAAQLRAGGDYEDAIAKYTLILEEYPDTPTGAGARDVTAETYAEWAANLRKNGDYEAAVEKYHTVLSTYPNTPAAADVQADESLAETTVEWASQLREDGLYAIAIRTYQTVIDEYPDTRSATTIRVEIGKTYNEWGKQLHSQRKFSEAMEKFLVNQEVSTDPDVIAIAEEGYEEALWGLSQASTGEGKEILEQALPTVCDGKPAESPAVGLAEDEPGKALFGGTQFKIPSAIKATSPGHFRYAVCLETGTSVLQRCPYTAGHTLVRQRKWWRVRVRDTRTARVVADRTFRGSSPGSCPFSRMFFGTTDYSTGGSPSSDQIVTWLQGVVR